MNRPERVFYTRKRAYAPPSQIQDGVRGPGFTHRELALKGRPTAVNPLSQLLRNVDDVFIGFDLHLNSP